MKNIIFSSLIIFISFIFGFELISNINYKRDIINPNDKGFSYFNKKNKGSVYFIGDSFASTNYVDEPYPFIFKNYFKSNKNNFLDLSRAGTNLSYHKTLLDSISKIKPKLIIYFYNVSDIVSLNEEILILNDDKEIKNNSNTKKITKAIYNSHTLTFFKNCLHYLSLKFTNEYFKGTPAYKFPYENKLRIKELELFFNSIIAENVVILINTPFEVGKKNKSMVHYNAFKNIKLNNNINLIQSADLNDSEKDAVSWRNVHPNQKTIINISDSLINIFKSKP